MAEATNSIQVAEPPPHRLHHSGSIVLLMGVLAGHTTVITDGVPPLLQVTLAEVPETKHRLPHKAELLEDQN